jgi:hypothetical protein
VVIRPDVLLCWAGCGGENSVEPEDEQFVVVPAVGIEMTGCVEQRSIQVPSMLTTIPAHDNRVTADVDARLTRLLERLVTQRGAHHANVTLMNGAGDQRWSAASSGPADTHDHPLRPDTPFFIASITKRFIITLVLQAHERGELELAAPIDSYLPTETTAGLHVLRGTDRTSEITVRHLASHTSGLPDHFEKRREGPSLYDRLAGGQDEVAAELEGVFDGLFAVVEAVADGLLEDVCDLLADFGAEVLADGVAAEGKGESGALLPPGAEIEDEVEAELLVGELAFVDDQACVNNTCQNHILNF